MVGYKNVGKGILVTTFTSSEGLDAGKFVEVDLCMIIDNEVVVVMYYNLYDNVYEFVCFFFG